MATSSGLRSTSVASGTLAGVPLAHVLVYVRNKELSGVLELRVAVDRYAWLVLWKGRVVSSMTTDPVARFAVVVQELGLALTGLLDATANDAGDSKQPQMEILLERGLLTHPQREQIIAEQVHRRVHHLFTFPDTTTFTFREGTPSTAEPAVAVDLLASVWRGLREYPSHARAGEVLARLGEHTLRLVARAPLERAGLDADEIALIDRLSHLPMTLRELRRASSLSTSRTDLLAYLLVICRCVEIEGRSGAALPSSQMWATTPPARPSDAPVSGHPSRERLTAATTPRPRGPLELGLAAIRQRAAGLATESPFALLGLAEGASSEAARAAYFRLGRLWNPSRLPADLEAVRAEVELIFAHMTRAHRLLTDPAARPATVARNKR